MHSERERYIRTDELQGVRPAVISVIGPTNEGKTSVLRTLTGDANFGEVNSLTGTTARAEIQKVFYRGQIEILRLIDTPGFQMSGEILGRLESDGDERPFSSENILRIIPELDADFRHDRRAWTEVAESDIILYIANVTGSPEQSLTRDTLTLLSEIARPVVVVFNSVAAEESGAGNFEPIWREELRRRGLFLAQDYDAHRRRFTDEYGLFEKIIALLPDELQRKAIRAELFERLRYERDRIERSRRVVAELLLDAALMSETSENVPVENTREETARLSERLSDRLSRREHEAHLELLSIWGYGAGILDRKQLSMEDEVSENSHVFGHQLTKQSLGVAKYGVTIGALVGLGLDVALAGLSLGTGTAVGTAVGAAVGAALGGAYNFAYDQKDKKLTARVGRPILPMLLARSVFLTRKLQERGKAMTDSIQLLLSGQPEKVEASAFFRRLAREIGRSPSARRDVLLRFSRQEPQKRSETIYELSLLLTDALRDPDIPV